MFQPTQEVIPYHTVQQLIGVYQAVIRDINEGYDHLEVAQAVLRTQLGNPGGSDYLSFQILDQYKDIPVEKSNTVARINGAFWQYILKKLEIEKVMGSKRASEVKARYKYDRFSDAPRVPELTVENVLEVIEMLKGNGADFAKELAMEVYNTLTPGRSDNTWMKRKTNVANARNRIGKKVILFGILGYYRRVEVRDSAEPDLLSIDKMFYLLDGKSLPTGTKCPLINAINTCTSGWGYTDYFTFKCYPGVGTLHLMFKRMDLVELLNQLCESNMIGDE
jgi:hypothetical protein